MTDVPVRPDHPWPWEPNADWWQELEPELVPVAQIGFSAPSVTIAGLIEHAAEPGRPGWGGDPYPHAVEHEGRHWIVDGHHRVTLALLSGAERIRARVRRWAE